MSNRNKKIAEKFFTARRLDRAYAELMAKRDAEAHAEDFKARRKCKRERKAAEREMMQAIKEVRE